MGSGAGQVFEGKNPGTLLAWTGAVDTQTALDAAGMIGFSQLDCAFDSVTRGGGKVACDQIGFLRVHCLILSG